MAQYYEGEPGTSGEGSRSRTVSELMLQLPVVAQFYRVLKDWQSEFKPRRYPR